MTEHFSGETDKFFGNHRGLVVDVNDPLLLGRIRVKVYPMFSGVLTAQIPWAVPAMPLFFGAGSSKGSFCVPTVGSYVWVFFEAGDIYQPVYFAEAQTKISGLPSSRVTNYPKRKVLLSDKIELIFDDATGDVILNCEGDLSVIASGDVEVDGIEVKIGASASEYVVLEQKLMTKYNTHTHASNGAVTTEQLIVGDVAATKVKAE